MWMAVTPCFCCFVYNQQTLPDACPVGTASKRSVLRPCRHYPGSSSHHLQPCRLEMVILFSDETVQHSGQPHRLWISVLGLLQQSSRDGVAQIAQFHGLTDLEAGSPNSRCWQKWFLGRRCPRPGSPGLSPWLIDAVFSPRFCMSSSLSAYLSQCPPLPLR